ncbi:hypothetical protein [Nitrobacter winogradskyi]|uniref:Uncharacterized protein n=2 Tax=Nitrobacter winogradskyi TaxID=913 RepID=A0ACC6ADK7_NITWI|nr:hypothetical protein [Nitrobacter winogradskyi]MCP1997613.1 hypothetical protein [Nitrobacter winogradskyi]
MRPAVCTIWGELEQEFQPGRSDYHLAKDDIFGQHYLPTRDGPRDRIHFYPNRTILPKDRLRDLTKDRLKISEASETFCMIAGFGAIAPLSTNHYPQIIVSIFLWIGSASAA